MGHRALVAVERPGGEFDCYRSQWAGGGPDDGDPVAAVDATVAGQRPLATGASVSRVLDLLAPRSDEALLVRSGDHTTRYLVRWLGVPTAHDDGDGPMVLVPTTDADAVDRLDCTLQTAKGILGDAVDAGLIPHWMAVGYLATTVARHPDVPGDTIWLGLRGDSGRSNGGDGTGAF